MNNQVNSNKVKLGMFRTEHLFFLQSNDSDVFLIFTIPEKYLKKEEKKFGSSELREVLNHRNGEIVICPDGVRFFLRNVSLYCDEAVIEFEKRAKENGFNVSYDCTTI